MTSVPNLCYYGGVGGADIVKEKKKEENKIPKGKKCIWCLQIKSYLEFDKYNKSSDGYRSQCNICIKQNKR